jgi:hypothetical protein
MKKWRVERAQRAIASPDPADCGTAWGMELSLPKEPKTQRRKRSPTA